MAIRVAVDAMGGDDAPAVVVDGAIRAVENSSDEVAVLLFGPEEQVRDALATAGAADHPALQPVDAPEVIEMGESPAAAVKTKKRSSIHLGLGAHKEGAADAFASAGNTGAVMAASLFILGRIEGVARPSVIGFFPTTEGACIVLDVGTNLDCKPEHLAQFAKMGSIYVSAVMGRDRPTVALLNVGEERGKGNEQVKAAYELLEKDDDITFRGNIEGRDILRHAADVVVCDGFVGNALLKFGESVASVFPQMIAEEMAKQSLSREHQGVVSKVLSGVRRRFDYEEFGGAPLLGVNGNVMIGHGGSSARAIERMILTAAEEAKHDVAGALVSALAR